MKYEKPELTLVEMDLDVITASLCASAADEHPVGELDFNSGVVCA